MVGISNLVKVVECAIAVWLPPQLNVILKLVNVHVSRVPSDNTATNVNKGIGITMNMDAKVKRK